MSFSFKPDVEEIPVTLSLLQLELLTTACRRQDFSLSFNREVTAPFRYELHQKRPLRASPHNMVCVLRSNDAMDVTRFLGLDIQMQEPGFPNASSLPTERINEPAGEAGTGKKDEEFLLGAVPLTQGVPTPLVVRELPRKDNGDLDHSSPLFRDRCQALRFKSGKPMMECKKALFGAGGNGDRALEILAQPRRYSSTV